MDAQKTSPFFLISQNLFYHYYRPPHTYKIGPLGYSLAGSCQKADPFLWNNDFEGKNLAATIDLDMPLGGELILLHSRAGGGVEQDQILSRSRLYPAHFRPQCHHSKGWKP